MSNVFNALFESDDYPISGEQVMLLLKSMDQDKPVYFARTTEYKHDKRKYPVNSFFSWRGSYEKPSCNTDGNEVYTVGQLLSVMDDFFSSIQTGWKGGKFSMSELDELWADSQGSYLETGVSSVIQDDENVYFVVKQFSY